MQLPGISTQAMDGERMEESVSRLPEAKELAMEEMTGEVTAAATFDADRAMLMEKRAVPATGCTEHGAAGGRVDP